jgi:hypothetical protein
MRTRRCDPLRHQDWPRSESESALTFWSEDRQVLRASGDSRGTLEGRVVPGSQPRKMVLSVGSCPVAALDALLAVEQGENLPASRVDAAQSYAFNPE